MNVTTLAWDISDLLDIKIDLEQRRQLEARLEEFARLIEQAIRCEYGDD